MKERDRGSGERGRGEGSYRALPSSISFLRTRRKENRGSVAFIIYIINASLNK